MLTAPTTGPVPAVLRVGDDTVVVDRAWPSAPEGSAGPLTIRFEGRDRQGRLRAGMLLAGGDGGDGGAASATLAPPGRDSRLPRLEAAAEDGELVVHRLGRRAVVRQDDRFVKVVRPGPGAQSLRARTLVGAGLVAAAGFATPEVLASDDGRLDLSVVRGAALHDSGATMGPVQWRRAWDAWARAWTTLTTSGPTATRSLPTHTASDELTILRTWLGHVRTFTALPRLEGELSRRCAALAEAFGTTPADPLVLSHRDLHDKQVLWDGATVGLLDLDTLAVAEPACDLANLAIHAELRVRQGRWSAAHGNEVVERVGEVAAALGVSSHRLSAYAEATRLRLTMLYAFRPRWTPLMEDWLHERSLIAVSSSSSHTLRGWRDSTSGSPFLPGPTARRATR